MQCNIMAGFQCKGKDSHERKPFATAASLPLAEDIEAEKPDSDRELTDVEVPDPDELEMEEAFMDELRKYHQEGDSD